MLIRSNQHQKDDENSENLINPDSDIINTDRFLNDFGNELLLTIHDDLEDGDIDDDDPFDLFGSNQIINKNNKSGKKNKPIFGDCDLDEWLTQPIRGQNNSFEYVRLPDCVKNHLKSFQFSRNFFAENGFSHLSSLIQLVVTDVVNSEMFKATPFFYKSAVANQVREGVKPDDITISIKSIEKRKSQPQSISTLLSDSSTDKSFQDLDVHALRSDASTMLVNMAITRIKERLNAKSKHYII